MQQGTVVQVSCQAQAAGDYRLQGGADLNALVTTTLAKDMSRYSNITDLNKTPDVDTVLRNCLKSAQKYTLPRYL